MARERMSQGQTAANTARHLGSGATRLARAWRALPHERRLAAYAASGLLLALFLPWYQRNFFTVIGGKLLPASDSQTAWAAFSWVEAAVLLVAAGVLTLLFNRAEGRAFHVPGGDGGVIALAGLWTSLLIIWRIFDKQGASSQGQYATTYGIEWGIFVALAVAAWLAYAGNQIRAAHRPEPPLPGEEPAAAARPPARAAAQPPEHATREQRAPAPRRARPAPDAPTAPTTGSPVPRRAPRFAPTRESAPRWESAPLRDRPQPPRDDPPPRGAPPPAPRSRRPLPPEEQLTIPLEERRED